MVILLEKVAIFIKQVIEFFINLDPDFVFYFYIQVYGNWLFRRFNLHRRGTGYRQQ